MTCSCGSGYNGTMRRPWLVGLVLVLVSRLVMFHFVPRPCEDAFITFRYARNLALGNGLTYNPGEWVMGFTSLPWTLWNSLGYLLAGSCEAWSRYSSLACDLGTVLIVSRILPGTASWCFAIGFGLLPMFSGICASGMEMSAGIFALSLLAWRRSWWSLVIAGTMRPETMLASGVITALSGWRRLWPGWLTVASASGLLWLTYGSPIPHSLVAKASVYQHLTWFSSIQWWFWALPLDYLSLSTSEPNNMMFLRVLAFPALVYGVMKSSGPARNLLFSLLAIWLCYAVSGVQYFSWYFEFPIFATVLGASIGLGHVLKTRLAFASVALALLGLWNPMLRLYRARAGNEEIRFVSAARVLEEVSFPGDTILAEPIGFIGYLTNRYIIDEVGLVSPSVTDYRKRGNGWYEDLVRDKKPTVIVARMSIVQGKGFSGSGEPFRSPESAQRVMGPYSSAPVVVGESSDPMALMLMRRR